MSRVLLAPALFLGLVMSALAPGGCDCDPEPVNTIVCDYTVVARGGDVIDFGAVVANDGSRSASFVVTNTGTVPLNAFAVSFSGNGDQYTVDLPDDFVVRPAEDETLVVTFAPTQATTLGAELRVTHPDPGADGCPVRTLTLRGEGVRAPEVDAGFPDAGPDDAGVFDAGVEQDAGFITPPDDGVVLPANAVWRAYGGLEEARAGFAHATLPDGTLLVVGGYGENGVVLDSIERFDPATGRSRVVARMARGRAEPGAVRLPDGRVVIVGGRSQRTDGVVVRTVEIFQPLDDTLACPGNQAAADGTCSDNALGWLPEGRIAPLVTRADVNRVVVAVGRQLDDMGAEVAFAGGHVLDLGTGAVTPIAGLPAVLDEARILGDGGAFVLIGGRNAAGQPSTGLVRFDGGAAMSALSLAATLPATRANAGTGTLEDGSVILVGGVGGNGAALGDVVVVREPFGDTVVEPQTVTVQPRVSPTVVTLPGDVVVVAGGLPAGLRGRAVDRSVLPLLSAEALVPFRSDFASFAVDNDLAAGHFGGAAVVVDDDTVVFAGGFATAPRLTPHPHAERYALENNVFVSFGLMGAGTALCAAALPTSGAALLSVGGVDPHTGVASSRTRAFDAENGVFVEAAPLAVARRDHTATSIAADLVVVIGGRDDSGATLTSASILDVDGADLPLPVSLRRGRAGHTATLLPPEAGLGDNAILVCGGTGNGGEPLDTCEVFVAPERPRDPSSYDTASFTLVEGRLATGRVRHTATLLDDGAVLLIGGADVEGAQVAADLFEPTGPRIVRSGIPVRARRDHAAVHIGGGRVLIVGGEVYDGGIVPTRSAELWVRSAATFVAVEDMEEARAKPAAFLLADGGVLVSGGTRDLGQPGFPTVSVVESERYTPGPTGVGVFDAVDVPLSYGRSDVLQADVFGRAVVLGGTHRDGVLATGDERRSPQHFVDMLEAAAP
ncbi:MAG: hypothetical protein FJ137_20355 [Deltaproteobacteria bacterium]|nr:hypothetical protein [Deltaproteobacteria bacterium]